MNMPKKNRKKPPHDFGHKKKIHPHLALAAGLMEKEDKTLPRAHMALHTQSVMVGLLCRWIPGGTEVDLILTGYGIPKSYESV